jgi:hypothetical protein
LCVDKSEGRLSAKLVQTLTRMGIDWDLPQRTWQNYCDAAAAFYQREGHLRVPYRHLEDGLDIHNWLRIQRDGRTSGTLAEEQRAALRSMGMQDI